MNSRPRGPRAGTSIPSSANRGSAFSTPGSPSPSAGTPSPFIPPDPARAASDDDGYRLPIPLAPQEGWLTIGLVVLMVLPVAWSIDNASWVLGREALTDFLPWAVIFGAAWGMLGAKVGWSRWTTHVLGAVMAGLIVPMMVGTVLAPNAPSLGASFQATADAVANTYVDFFQLGRQFTQEFGHHLLVLGLLCWGTGQFAGYAALGHRRPLSAALITGLVLVGNMSITARDQLVYLITFSLAALFLLVRLHAFDERASWLRRRIGDPAAVGGLYLRGGTIFVAVAVIGSYLLTTAASSRPLAGAFADLDQKIIDIGQQFQNLLPQGGKSRFTGVSFGPTAPIKGLWVTDDKPALRMTVAPGDKKQYYWRAYAYDTFELTGWKLSAGSSVDVPAGQPLLQGTGDQLPSTLGVQSLAFTVEPLDLKSSVIFSPASPDTVDVPTSLALVGPGQFFGSLSGAPSGGAYRVTAKVPIVGQAGFTENNLRAAGTSYPPGLLAQYLVLPPGAAGKDALALLSKVRATLKDSNPYDLAKALTSYLKDPANFTYSTDVLDTNCSISVVDCFVQYRRGYCQYYASTLAVLLRYAGVPARLAQGFLPGQRDPVTGQEVLRDNDAHAWVEVYFPGYGWVPFDPTGGGVAQLAPLPSGLPVPSASPNASSGADLGTFRPRNTRRPGEDPTGATGTTGRPGTGTGAYLVVGILLILAVAGLAFIAYRRGPRGPTQPEQVWSGVSRIASRFGFGPRPTQTVFEYADALATALPMARPELQVVAAAKVEVTYGRRVLGPDRLVQLREAHRRLRLALLRLAFRRRRRRGGRSS